MADKSVISDVRSLLDKLSAHPTPSPQKILRILQKLSELPISIDVLHETGIGKVVNGLRKHEGEIGESARSLVRRWKAMVQEAMDEEANRQESLEAQNQANRKESPQQPSMQSYALQQPPPTQSRSPSKHQIPPHSQGQIKLHSTSPSSSKSHGSLKRPRADDVSEEGYTQLKEKHPSSGSPLKKLKSHHPHGDGTAKVQVKREIIISVTPKVHVASEKKITKDAHTPHEKSHNKSYEKSRDKSHDLHVASTSGVKTSDHKAGSHSKHDHASHEKHNIEHNRKDGIKSKISPNRNLSPKLQRSKEYIKEEHSHRTGANSLMSLRTPNAELKSESRSEKTTKSVGHDKTTPVGSGSSGKSNSAKNGIEAKMFLSSTSDSLTKERAKARTSPLDSQKSKLQPSSTTKKSNEACGKRNEDNDNYDDDADEKTYHNTGMSFGDCLMGPMVTKANKVTNTKTSPSFKHPTKTATRPHGTSKSSTTGTSNAKSPSTLKTLKIKERQSSSSKPKVKGESLGGKSETSKNAVTGDKKKPVAKKGEKISEGQGSEKGHKSDAGRRHRKKRSMSEEEEEAIKMAKKARSESSDVSLNLPEIQPNYKPIRLPEVASPSKKRTLTPEEELAYLGSKQGRTKVFSGRSRVNRLTSVPRLYDICMDILCDNIDALEEVGGVPYDILYPVLQRCTPHQLFHLEDVNPHFLEDTDPLWQKHVERDFKGKHPAEMESWRELYIRKFDEREARLKSITANISAQMAAKDPGRLTKMAYLDRPAKPPRNVMRQQLRHGTASGVFLPEKRSKSSVQPNRSSGVVIDSTKPSNLHHRPTKRKRKKKKRKLATKIVAPMMMKTLKMIKKLRR